jgi:hypothetical protein
MSSASATSAVRCHRRGPQLLINTINTEWGLLTGQSWDPHLATSGGLFHGHRHPDVKRQGRSSVTTRYLVSGIRLRIYRALGFAAGK